MANCKDVFTFLDGVRGRSVATTLPAPDLAMLAQAGLIRTVSADEYAQLQQNLSTMDTGRAMIGQEMANRARLAGQVASETARTHSILFHLEGQARRQAETEQAARDADALRREDADLVAREQQFNALLGQRALMDSLTPYAGQYVALTGFGVLKTRELGLALYRTSDLEFSAYWPQAQQVEAELNGLGDRSATYFAQLGPRLAASDRSYVWAISVGLAKSQPDVAQGTAALLGAYGAIGSLAHNDENRLLSAEILAAIPRPIDQSVPALGALEHDVRKAGVPKESSLGVASLLLLGQRQDGTFALPQLAQFLKLTRSYESAALLAIVNRPYEELAAKFGALRSLFASWGFQMSEDEELAASYLTVSDLPADGIGTKLTILTRGLLTYLEYPLVAASILASIPVLEANETLNLLERAYEVIGRRAMPMTQPELICLAVRMIHGIRSETVGGLDATAAAKTPAGFTYAPTQRFFFVPIIVLHGSYYSTFGGFGGAHAGHVHAFGGAVG